MMPVERRVLFCRPSLQRRSSMPSIAAPWRCHEIGSASRAGVSDCVNFQLARAMECPGNDFGLVTRFDCLHDLGEPVGATRLVREALASDGMWLIVESIARDEPKDNLNPGERVYYSLSALLCTPCSRSQQVGLSLGAQDAEQQMRNVLTPGASVVSGVRRKRHLIASPRQESGHTCRTRAASEPRPPKAPPVRALPRTDSIDV